MSIIHDPALYQLRHALRGHLYGPGEPEYEDARTLFNAMVETRPRHVARVSHPHQVSAALAFARARGMRVAVRGGGHSVAGASLVEDGLVIDVRGLRELVVDPERRVVRAGGGLTWGEVDAATQEHGLATVGGRVSSTGVAGLALGGGSGWLERKHGLTVDNILAVELITASGEPIRASADGGEAVLLRRGVDLAPGQAAAGADDPPLGVDDQLAQAADCLLYTSPSPRDGLLSRMPSSA